MDGKVLLLALHPLTSLVRPASLTGTYPEQRKVCIDSAAKKAFSIHIQLNSLRYTFYSTNSINLTLPSGPRRPLSLSVSPVHSGLIQSFLPRL